MSSDSSDTTPSANPLDVAVEGLVIRPDAFDTPVATANGSDRKTLVAPALAAVAREKADLSLTATHVFPLWALIPIIGVVLAAGSFLGANMALGPNVKGYDYALQFPDGADPGGGMAVDEYDPKIWLAKGKGEYATVCASCHQATGEGVPGQFPPLKNSEWVIGGEERVAALLLHGIVGPLQVNGKSYNGAMPAQGALKNNKAIAQLVSYIRNEWGNKASIVYDDQVAELRKTLASRTGPYTEAELKAIPADANLPPSKHGLVDPAVPVAAGAAPAAAPAPAPATK